MNGQVYALSTLLLAVSVCAAAMGFAVGRLTGRWRDRRQDQTQSETVLAGALEDGLAKLKAQQKVMTERAVASERLNTQIVENLTAGLLLVDGHGAIELVNPAARTLLAGPALEPGAFVADALATAPDLVSLIEQCRTTHQPVSRRTIAVSGAGGPMHLGVTVSPIDRAERSGGVICLFSDLTAIVEMEDQLRLKDALARLGELTAGLAHEFRNGLATIHGYARLLDPALLPDRYRPYIESLRSETDQLGRVVTHFLNFARPEALSSVRLALRDVVARAIDEVRRDLPSDTVLEISGDFGEVDGDEQLLKQAFDNLCRNACQACTEAGIRPEIRVHGLVDHAHRTVHVTVDDNGPGVPELERAKVFQPFFSTRANGTGLGLSIVQKIVLAHNGRISVAAAPGRGARFEVSLPCADRQESSLARPA